MAERPVVRPRPGHLHCTGRRRQRPADGDVVETADLRSAHRRYVGKNNRAVIVVEAAIVRPTARHDQGQRGVTGQRPADDHPVERRGPRAADGRVAVEHHGPVVVTERSAVRPRPGHLHHARGRRQRPADHHVVETTGGRTAHYRYVGENNRSAVWIVGPVVRPAAGHDHRHRAGAGQRSVDEHMVERRGPRAADFGCPIELNASAVMDKRPVVRPHPGDRHGRRGSRQRTADAHMVEGRRAGSAHGRVASKIHDPAVGVERAAVREVTDQIEGFGRRQRSADGDVVERIGHRVAHDCRAAKRDGAGVVGKDAGSVRKIPAAIHHLV